ncbi:hypothetical protein PanWU01x14_334200 [Parasponia andersonii]|uniref:Uncharacterized protein n=1 Tax=Parasponia andersonii TaxID=3476 RepID=A0A2P5AGM5_PARAD|nr:hypothetical protein PanWU01x14_334200 [Parasponia andersonii]
MFMDLAKQRSREEKLSPGGPFENGAAVFWSVSAVPAIIVMRTSGGGPPERRVKASRSIGHCTPCDTPISRMCRLHVRSFSSPRSWRIEEFAMLLGKANQGLTS